MKLISIACLLAISCLVLINESRATDELNNGVDSQKEYSTMEELDGPDEDEEEHVRVARSPGWRRRFRVRVRVRKPIRKIGSFVRKTARKVGQGVRKVGQGIKKVARKVKTGVKKLASKTKAAIKKAASKLKGAAKRVKEKMRSSMRRLKEKVKKIVKAPKNLAKKIKDKLKSLVAKDKIEIEEPETVEPTLATSQATASVVTKPVCSSACQFIKSCLKEAETFKQTYCAFYMVKRKHTDFLIDRNFNVTLEYIINDILKESWYFYSTLSEVLLAADPSIKFESKAKVSADCARGKFMTCRSDDGKNALFKMKCMKPCLGFTQCEVSDKQLKHAINQGIQDYTMAVERTLKLLNEN